MMKISKYEILCVAVIALFAVGNALGANPLYNFQAGVSNGLNPSTTYAVPGTSLRSDTPTTNYGTSVNFTETTTGSGNRAGLMMFNISAAASAANTQGVQSATLTLVSDGSFSSSNTTATFTVWLLPPGNTSWTGTTGTFNNQIQTSSTPWKLTSGSNATDGITASRNGQNMGSWTGPLPTNGQQIQIPLDPSIIANLLANPAQNVGFVVYYSATPTNSGNGSFYSSNATTSSYRPLLTIEIPTLRTSVDISKPPYNATTSMSDVGLIINQAISDMAALGGGTVYIPAGNWTFSTPISIPSASGGSIILRGDGAHIAGQSGGTDLIFTTADGTSDAITVDGTSNPANFARVFIRELAIDGGTQAQVTSGTLPSNHYGLNLYNANFYQLNFVTVSGFNVAGIEINNSFYGSIRDADVGYCGTGVDCTTANSDQFLNLSVHNCTTRAMHNPQQLVGCSIENNNMDGIVLDATGLGLSLHDCYFANNNATNSGEHADISAAGGNPTLSISGHSEFNGTTPESTTVPYRRLMGTFDVVTRTGAAHFLTTAHFASFDVTNTLFQDASTEPTEGNLTWKTGTTGNTYKWNFHTETSLNTLLP